MDIEKMRQTGGTLRDILSMLSKSENGLESFLEEWMYPHDGGDYYQSKWINVSPGVETRIYVDSDEQTS